VPWVDDGGTTTAAVPRVFDLATGREVGPGSVWVTPGTASLRLEPGEDSKVEVALGASIDALLPGSYAVVACIPDLGLASPVGTLRVVDDSRSAEISVLSYLPNGAFMDALAVGSLAVRNGCLAIEHPGGTTYVLWPEGYALVHRDGRTVLVDPVGTEAGALGDEVSLGGGGAPLRLVEDSVIGGIPESCRTGGGYFITSGAG
jgi:hypothetical protein